jgi:hypothetical protein
MHPGPLLTLADERPVQLVETVAVSFATAFEPAPTEEDVAVLPLPVAVLVAVPPRAADELAVPPVVAVDAALLRKPEADAFAWLPVPVAVLVAVPPRTEDEVALPPVVPVDVALLIESAFALALLPVPLTVTVQPPLVPVEV